MKYSICLYLTLLFSLVSSCSGQEKNRIWKETIGTYSYQGYKNAKMRYFVDGVPFSVTYKPDIATNVNGEKYTMKYNVKEPDEIKIDYWNPIFEEGEKTYVSIAQITIYHKKSFWHTWPAITFKYYANTMKYDKSVYLSANHDKLYPNLQEGQFYYIEVWEENNGRAKIYLDRPVPDSIVKKYHVN
jgi:hypothetical protein